MWRSRMSLFANGVLQISHIKSVGGTSSATTKHEVIII